MKDRCEVLEQNRGTKGKKMHLMDNDLYSLAVLTDNGWSYNCAELVKMEHIRLCGSCYKRFCIALAISAMMGESGHMNFSQFI